MIEGTLSSELRQYAQKGYWSFSDIHGLVSFCEGHFIKYGVVINSVKYGMMFFDIWDNNKYVPIKKMWYFHEWLCQHMCYWWQRSDTYLFNVTQISLWFTGENDILIILESKF